MRAKVADAGLEGRIEVDSAGTGDWHVGEAPDARARRAASARGLALESTARQVRESDLEDFDLIVAMDRANLRALERLAAGAPDRAELRLLREFEPGAEGRELEVPDPYHGGPEGFGRVLDLLEASCDGLLAELVRRMHGVAREDEDLGAPEVSR